MKLSIIGAGHMGSAIAQHLIEHDDVSLVQICDAHTRSLQNLHDTLDSPKLRSFQVDARDDRTMASILSDSDCIVAASAPALNPALARIALSIGSHFCDLGSSHSILQKEYKLNKLAEEHGLWVVPNCGLDPGLANMLALLGARQFDQVESIRIRVGDVPLHPEPPFNFRISWSSEKLLDDYTAPVVRLENGVEIMEEPLSGVESIHFPGAFQNMEAFHTAGTLETVRTASGPGLQSIDHKTIRWPGHAEQMQFLLALGFGEEKNIDVRTHLTYRDVLARRMKQRMGGDYQDAVLLRVMVSGQKDGRAQELTYQMIDTFDTERNMTSIRRCTSITAATIAMQLASGSVRKGGVGAPERVVPLEAFHDSVRKAGLPITEIWSDL